MTSQHHLIWGTCISWTRSFTIKGEAEGHPEGDWSPCANVLTQLIHLSCLLLIATQRFLGSVRCDKLGAACLFESWVPLVLLSPGFFFHLPYTWCIEACQSIHFLTFPTCPQPGFWQYSFSSCRTTLFFTFCFINSSYLDISGFSLETFAFTHQEFTHKLVSCFSNQGTLTPGVAVTSA